MAGEQQTRKRILVVALGILVIVIVSAISLLTYMQKIGCQSGALLLSPVSLDGKSIVSPSQPGACFVSFASLRDRNVEIGRITCSEVANYTTCQAHKKELSLGWDNLLGSRCTSAVYFGGANCDCVATGEGCQQVHWNIELAE
jgi:hypothetical protein